jgi:fructose-specific phosphotransferase system IIC component
MKPVYEELASRCVNAALIGLILGLMVTIVLGAP